MHQLLLQISFRAEVCQVSAENLDTTSSYLSLVILSLAQMQAARNTRVYKEQAINALAAIEGPASRVSTLARLWRFISFPSSK
jgi:hypothetical protein